MAWTRFQFSFLVLGLISLTSFALHLTVINDLNIVEDESAYMQDAAQISWDVLPFREFGGTKGPGFLVALKFWQLLVGETLFSSRLFAVLAHVASIPFLFLVARNIVHSRRIAYFSAFLWGVTPVVVSLTTNVTHIPLELLLIFASASLLSAPTVSTKSTIGAACLTFAALLTRATSISFLPLFFFLLFIRTRSWRKILLFAATGLALLLVTVGIVYPLYGWPKTAFFFNIDATLIANKQRAVYAATTKTTSLPVTYFRAALPAWREGLVVMLTALLLPCIWLSQRLYRTVGLVLCGALAIILGPLILEDINVWWPSDKFAVISFSAHVIISLSLILGIIAIIQARKLPRIEKHVLSTIGLWVGAFVLFYQGWGRTPTPYYILESLPALSIAAAITLGSIVRLLDPLPKHIRQFSAAILIGLFALALLSPYRALAIRQYRGSLEVQAAQAMVQHIRTIVPPGEPLFTGQPVFAYLSGHPLYGGYTHPGWYLSERAGYLPAEIRSVFLPDFDALAEQLAADVNWVVVDWRTYDIFFKEGDPATTLFRSTLEKNFTSVLSVPNESSTEITLYKRTDSQ